jgi:glycosyltransferase involved in cell wall biosynthesis
MDIAVLVYFDVRKVHGGGAQRVWGLCTSLARRGIHVTLYMNGSSQNSDSIVLQDGVQCVSMRFKPLPITRMLGPLSLNNLRIAVGLNNQISRKRIDILQLEFPYMLPTALIARARAVPIILDAHGVEVDFWREVGPLMRHPVHTLSLYATKFEECIAVRLSSHVLTCSRVDAIRLAELYRLPKNKFTVVPNFVMNETLEHVVPHHYEKKCVLFMGSPIHAPNAYALDLICKRIVPTLLRRRSDLQFAFIGRGLPSWLLGKDVIPIGEVKDMRPYLQGATVCIAPIYHGSGTRVKILDYLASKVAVVSTAKGAQGIDGLVDGDNIIIRNDVEEFENAILDLVDDDQKRLRIAQRGYELVKRHYSADVAAEKAAKVYESLV